jgi:hypothetical protein
MYERHKSLCRVEWQLRVEMRIFLYVRNMDSSLEPPGRTTGSSSGRMEA